MEIDHEIFSMVILLVMLIQEGHAINYMRKYVHRDLVSSLVSACSNIKSG